MKGVLFLREVKGGFLDNYDLVFQPGRDIPGDDACTLGKEVVLFTGHISFAYVGREIAWRLLDAMGVSFHRKGSHIIIE
jgi:hypothetical protein